MKHISLFTMVLGVAALTSCKSIQQTAVVVDDMENRVYQHPLVAELKTQPQAELTMTRKQLKGVMDKEAYITAELLKKSNSDVLLEERTTVVRKGLMHRLSSMTVSGIPAKYENYRSATEKDMVEFLNPEVDEHSMLQPIIADGDFRQFTFNTSGGNRLFGSSNGTKKIKSPKPEFVPGTHFDLGLLVGYGAGLEAGWVRYKRPWVAWDVLKLRFSYRPESEAPISDRNDLSHDNFEDFGWYGKDEYHNGRFEYGFKSGFRFSTREARKGQKLFAAFDLGFSVLRLRCADPYTRDIYTPGHWEEYYDTYHWVDGHKSTERRTKGVTVGGFSTDITVGLKVCRRLYLAYQFSGLAAFGGYGGEVAHYAKIGLSF